MVKYRLSTLAGEDLTNIYNYTFENFGEVMAEDYLLSIEKCIARICLNPDIAICAGEIRRGYFKYPVRKHLIYFKFHESTIHIIRVLHQRMKLQQHLNSE